MAVVVAGPPALSGDLVLFHTTDPLLSNSPVLVFHGPAASLGAISSRIQVHVFTPAGIGSYARLAVSPNSPFWSAVDSLPRDAKGDEVCRGIAFGLKKYFVELPEDVKKTWCAQVKAPSSAMLFGDQHVAVLASRMQKVENATEVISILDQAFAEERQSWLDVDVVLPPGSIKETTTRKDSVGSEDLNEAEALHQRYGRYAELIASFGDTTFMPTSKIKRAPSKSTSIGRTASFLKHQKENVRKELCELVGTEESYVERIKELQDIATSIGADLKPPSRQQIQSVFPDTLSGIVDVNTRFLESLRVLLDSTEATALADIETTSGAQFSAQQMRRDLLEDAQGVVAIAKCLCEWLPQFAECYGPYLKSQADSSQLLRSLFRSTDTALAGELLEIGEQKLTSLLIEPVQRLPRYNLYIDGITKQLPIRHPAIKHLLRARDIVTEICAQDDGSVESSNVEEKLRSRVHGWPSDCHITGRLVTVTDYSSLPPPFLLHGPDTERGILLVFTDGIVLLEKHGDSAMTARSLQTELEAVVLAPQPLFAKAGASQGLSFVRKVRLDALQCSEMHGGKVLQLYIRFELDTAAKPAQLTAIHSSHFLRLETAYDGKAARLVEELSKARIEARFSEAERESSKWEVRCTDASADHASLLSAIHEDTDTAHIDGRSGCAPVRIIVDIDKHSQRPRAGSNGIRTVIALSPLKDGLWRMTIDSVDGPASREHLAAEDVIPTMSKRLALLAAAQFGIQQVTMTTCLLVRYGETLASIDLQFHTEEDEDGSNNDSRDRIRRPKSPRKLLSSFLASAGPGSQYPATFKKDLPPLPPPRPASSFYVPSKPPSRESRPSSKDQPTPRSISSTRSLDQLSNPIHKKLEDTLRAYLLALKARKGNIVGRSLKMRASAEEIVVNELYNSLLEDPNMMVIAAQATVDVLFAAFEKFLNIAWKEQIGQIMPYAIIQEIQTKAETLFPADFDEYFRTTLGTFPPQNKRAFKAIMELLADLLDGTGNDGDRGILTAAFAEVLVTEGNPHDFIALIDRFVDDPDTYFGEPLDDVQKHGDVFGGSHKRARSMNSASISSNSSSLRKKFGFGNLTRANSRTEEESKVASVWRTLSKSTRAGESPAGSITKASLHRSHSTDLDARKVPSRPSSQDGPARKTPGFEDVHSFPSSTSTTNLGLATIGEHPSFIPTGPPRKKRRSSLSDLHALDKAQKPQSWMTSPPPAAARRPALSQRQTIDDKSLPNSPMPSTPSSKGGSGKFESPSREPLRSRLPSSFRKENSPGNNKVFGVVEPLRPRSGSKQADDVVITARPTSGIPTLAPKSSGSPVKGTSPSSRVGLSERAGAGNIVKNPSPQADKMIQSTASAPTDGPSSRKLRMQSPQKLRERLQNEQIAAISTQTSLQEELSKIGDELTATSSRIGSVRTPKSTTGRAVFGAQPSTMDLAQRVLKMEGQVVKQIDELKARIASVQADLSSSLAVSENKCKKLDELYRESHGENDALYTRFNDELSRILKAVRGGDGVEELKKKLKEAQEEAAKLRRETSRLKRENVGLRAQLKE
ncbi:hypothetical protein M433DRAFT_66651 [Acidomyces richmondensis BFW]|nr:MAG: hypothetical protein FE78DRAFT_70680 [Acidomyces sp. 'richmondensis']KYG45727.1 hypothetical protein M433DRAFT_66651 [Acidomyces richmondensis BFW]